MKHEEEFMVPALLLQSSAAGGRQEHAARSLVGERISRHGGDGIAFAPETTEGSPMADDEDDDLTVVPLPTGETEAEHRRIRSSNDRDQRLEREGKVAPHNRGYDEAADGVARSDGEPAIDKG
jgi:hypothetical protein